jgi:hypothetical protein
MNRVNALKEKKPIHWIVDLPGKFTNTVLVVGLALP